MRLALVVSAGWLAVLAVLLGEHAVAAGIVIALLTLAFWPEPCVAGHELRTYEARDERLQWYWVPFRCVSCNRLTDDVRPDWAVDR